MSDAFWVGMWMFCTFTAVVGTICYTVHKYNVLSHEEIRDE